MTKTHVIIGLAVLAGLYLFVHASMGAQGRPIVPTLKVDVPPLGGLPSYPIASPTARKQQVFGLVYHSA